MRHKPKKSKEEKTAEEFFPANPEKIKYTVEKPIKEVNENDLVEIEKDELKKFEGLVGKDGNASTEKTEQNIPPNPPFNLTTLQTEAYSLYGINPSKTLAIAQSLYLSGLISYPRTSSQP